MQTKLNFYDTVEWISEHKAVAIGLKATAVAGLTAVVANPTVMNFLMQWGRTSGLDRMFWNTNPALYTALTGIGVVAGVGLSTGLFKDILQESKKLFELPKGKQKNSWKPETIQNSEVIKNTEDYKKFKTYEFVKCDFKFVKPVLNQKRLGFKVVESKLYTVYNGARIVIGKTNNEYVMFYMRVDKTGVVTFDTQEEIINIFSKQ